MNRHPYFYLAEPIDFADDGGGQALWARTVVAHLDVAYYSPAMAWSARPPFPPIIAAVNNLALGGAAGLIVAWKRISQSIGVPMEIQRASDLGMPIWWVSLDDPSRSASLAGVPNLTWVRDPAMLRLAVGDDSEAQAQPPSREETPVIQYTSQGGDPPEDHYEGDAGYDLAVTESVTVLPGERAHVRCGISIALPPGYWAMIQGRSSSWRRGLLVKGSIIDAGYRGPLWADFINLNDDAVTVKKGERIAQLIPMPLAPRMAWEQVLFLPPSDRGTSGYGSTGS